MKRGDWEARYGALRRAKDKALIAALEAQLAAEEAKAHETIAKAFGRPA